MRKSLLRILSTTVILPIAVCAEITTQHLDTNIQPLTLTSGPDQTIVDFNTVQWQPLQVDGLPKGAEISVLRGNLETGFSESLIRLPNGYKVPMHNHTSDEVYVWIKGAFTLLSQNNKQVKFDGAAYINFPGNASMHALECRAKSGCLLYLRYTRPFDIHFARTSRIQQSRENSHE